MRKAHSAPRCGAHARTTGNPCKAPAMANGRCRMHGGKSTGAPTGKANGNYKHGKQTQERTAQRQAYRGLMSDARNSARQANLTLGIFKQAARDLGVRWPKLWQLCTKGDGGAKLTLFIAKRLSKTKPDI